MFKNISFSGLESNILKYTVFAVCNKRLFISILGAFYLTIEGVTPTHIGYITAIGALLAIALEVPIIYYGIFFAIGRLLASALLALNGKIKTYFTLKSFYLFEILTFTALFVLLGIFQNPVVVVTILVLMNALLWGLSQVPMGFKMEILSKSRYKATLISTIGQIDHIVIIASGLIFGALVEKLSYAHAYAAFGLGFFMVLMLIYTLCMRKR